jgi:hypothetical protein
MTENGCKPGIGYVLFERAGEVTGGKVYVLDPQHPRDLSKGVHYALRNLVHEDKTIKCDVSIIDESSPRKIMEMHLTITLKDELKGRNVQAEVGVNGGPEKESILLECNDESVSR